MFCLCFVLCVFFCFFCLFVCFVCLFVFVVVVVVVVVVCFFFFFVFFVCFFVFCCCFFSTGVQDSKRKLSPLYKSQVLPAPLNNGRKILAKVTRNAAIIKHSLSMAPKEVETMANEKKK